MQALSLKKAKFNEYVKDVKSDIKIRKGNYYFHVVTVQVQTLAFLCKNLNYKSQSINQSLSVTCVLVVLILLYVK